jgi:CrcB protein
MGLAVTAAVADGSCSSIGRVVAMDGRTGPPSDGDLPIDPDLGRGRIARDPTVLAVIALGGMAGASARYGVNRWIPPQPGGFPWATFWINVSGSFVLGMLLVIVLERLQPTRLLRPFLATGVLGAFTTMSTFQVETALLLKDGHVATAAVYSIGSVVAGIAFAYLGLVAGRRTLPRPGSATP